MRLGQLQLVNCDIFKTTTVVQNKRSFSLNKCERICVLDEGRLQWISKQRAKCCYLRWVTVCL